MTFSLSINQWRMLRRLALARGRGTFRQIRNHRPRGLEERDIEVLEGFGLIEPIDALLEYALTAAGREAAELGEVVTTWDRYKAVTAAALKSRLGKLRSRAGRSASASTATPGPGRSAAGSGRATRSGRPKAGRPSSPR